VDDKKVRDVFRLDFISSKSLEDRRESTQRTAKSIRYYLRWMDRGSRPLSHYILLLRGERFPLIAFQPIPDYSESIDGEYQMDAAAHEQFIENTLAYYERPTEALIFLVGDNCSTNRALATRLGIPLVGCASHNLNLAVKNHLKSMEPILKKLDWLMSKLSTLKQSAKLRRRTSLLPVKRNVNWYSSTFSMVERL
jgi:hypothetical protein